MSPTITSSGSRLTSMLGSIMSPALAWWVVLHKAPKRGPKSPIRSCVVNAYLAPCVLKCYQSLRDGTAGSSVSVGLDGEKRRKF